MFTNKSLVLTVFEWVFIGLIALGFYLYPTAIAAWVMTVVPPVVWGQDTFITAIAMVLLLLYVYLMYSLLIVDQLFYASRGKTSAYGKKALYTFGGLLSLSGSIAGLLALYRLKGSSAYELTFLIAISVVVVILVKLIAVFTKSKEKSS